MKRLIMFASFLMPWPLRRLLLASVFGYKIDPTARIGLAWVNPRRLVMRANSRIGHLTVVKGLDLLELDEYATIERGNWITAFPSTDKKHFSDRPDRRPELTLGAHAAITSRHILDCTDSIHIGRFAIVGGFCSQLITHSIDWETCRQTCAPIAIGNYCFVGTDCTVFGNANLPDFSILGAKSMLREKLEDPYFLYAGVPARAVKPLDESLQFFHRNEGVVY
jgi:acetyltransferase-like isoleucine patch superfamily enzyme